MVVVGLYIAYRTTLTSSIGSPIKSSNDLSFDDLIGGDEGAERRRLHHSHLRHLDPRAFARRLRRLVSSVYPPIYLAIHHWGEGRLTFILLMHIWNRAANWLWPALTIYLKVVMRLTQHSQPPPKDDQMTKININLGAAAILKSVKRP